MNDWWKTALTGAAGVGLLAASGGTLAAPFAGILGSAGEGAAAAGAAGADAAATTGSMLAADGAAAAASPATAFVTPPVTGMLGSTSNLAGSLAGTDLGYGSAASNSLLATGGEASGGTGAASGALAGTELGYGTGPLAGGAPFGPSSVPMATATPTPMQQAMQYAKMGGKAASAYGTINNAMAAGQQPQMPAPQGRPIFSGDTPSIAQAAGAGSMQPAANQNLLLAQIARRRQMGY